MLIVILIAVATLAVALFFLFRLFMSDPAANQTEITVEGSITCLPHKSKEQVTLECTAGILADDGRHYAIRSTNSNVQIATLPGGSRVQITGNLLQPPADERYDVVGIIEVTKVMQK